MRPGPSLQRWRGGGPKGWPSLRWWSDWDAGALGEEWALCAAPQGFPTEEQEDAGCRRLLSVAPVKGRRGAESLGSLLAILRKSGTKEKGISSPWTPSRRQRMAEMGLPGSQLREGGGAGGRTRGAPL